MLDLVQVLPQVERMADAKQRAAALAEFQARYNVTWTCETFTLDAPGAGGTFVLKPDGGDPLPPVGCKVKVHGYRGEMWQTVVTGMNEAAGTYTALITQSGGISCAS